MNKKLLLLSFLLLLLQSPAIAFRTLGDLPYSSEMSPIGQSPGFQYIMGGGVFTGITIPLDTAKAPAFNTNKKSDEFIPISNITKNLGSSEKNLKIGTSSRTNILRLVETGDAGINKAAKDGHITKIHYVEYSKEKLYVPLGFIPIYYDRYITTVYGE